MNAASASLNRTARVAGFLYLVMGLPVAFDVFFVRSSLIVANDPAATAANILASETLFRIGLASGVLSSVAAVGVATVLYRVFEDVDRTLSRLMAYFLLLSVPIVLLNLAHGTAALLLVKQQSYLAMFDRNALETAALVFLSVQRHGLVIAQIFWGVWLFPLGLLVARSGYMPRSIGFLLLVAGFAYVLGSLVWLLAPQFARFVSMVGMIPEAAGEVSFIVWLLAKGVKHSGTAPEVSRSARGDG